MPIYDVSVPVTNDVAIYPGDPKPAIKAAKTIAGGDAANVTALDFGAHTCTHVDAPRHFIEGAPTVSELRIESLIGEARVIEIPDDAQEIAPEHVTEAAVRGATRVLFRTRNSAFWNTDPNTFREDYAYLGEAAAHELVRRGVRVVGIDYLSIEEMGSKTFPVHHALLSKGVVIIEGLNPSATPAGVYELICLPLRLAAGAGDGAPARVVLRTPDEGDAT